VRTITGLLSCLLLAACVSTQEMPLAPNIVRLDTQARGALWAGSASTVTLKRAAEATLVRGYTHFRLDQAQMSQGRQLVGVVGSGSGTATATAVGNSVFVTGTSTGYSTPVYAPTSSVGVTVIMFHANEPGAAGAFDAAQIVKQYGG